MDAMIMRVKELNNQVFGGANNRVTMHDWLSKFINKIDPGQLKNLEQAMRNSHADQNGNE